ncbi:MAG: transketolase C-terminal domain-containing protein [Rectinema sp.]
MADQKEMRAVYVETLMSLVEEGKDIIVLEADLMRATGTTAFAKKYPERAINVGVAEADLVGVASGLSAGGKIPFAATFGCFASRRAYDQFFLSANYAHLNVKLVGTDPGVTAAYNGGTHMPFEDLTLMRVIPNLTIAEPSDGTSLAAVTRIAAETDGCFYLRLQRKAAPQIYPDDETFELGRAKVLRRGKDVTLVALGTVMVNEALKAAASLAEEGIEATVIDAIWLAPLDEATILANSPSGRIVTCENHRVTGALGSAVAELIAEKAPGMRLARIGVAANLFGEVGTLEWLAERFELTAPHIAEAARKLMR